MGSRQLDIDTPPAGTYLNSDELATRRRRINRNYHAPLHTGFAQLILEGAEDA